MRKKSNIGIAGGSVGIAGGSVGVTDGVRTETGTGVSVGAATESTAGVRKKNAVETSRKNPGKAVAERRTDTVRRNATECGGRRRRL